MPAFPLPPPPYPPPLQSGSQRFGSQAFCNYATVVPTTGNATYAPFWVTNPSMAFDTIGLRSTVAASSNGRIRLGVYTDFNGFPANLVVDSGLMVSSCTATLIEAPISTTLPQGLYWLCGVAQSTAGTTVTHATVASFNVAAQVTGSNYASSGVLLGYASAAGAVTTVLPSTANVAAGATGTPLCVELRTL